MLAYPVGTPVRSVNSRSGEVVDGTVVENENVWERDGELRGWYVIRDAAGRAWETLHKVTVYRPEAGDVVRVMTPNGEIGYFGEATDFTDEPGRYAIMTPDDGEVHSVPHHYVWPATEAETDAYIERWVDSRD